MRAHTPTVCAHCGRHLGRSDLHRCAEDPAIVDRLARLLPDPHRPGYILPMDVYDALPSRPISSVVLMRTYRSWSALAVRYGLHSRATAQVAPPAEKPAYTLTADVIAAMRRLSHQLHDGCIGPSSREYNDRRGDNASSAFLTTHLGSWGAVLAGCGLQPGTLADYHKAANARRRAAGRLAHVRDRPVRGRLSLDRGDEPVSREYTGLPVLQPPRLLPGGGVAWMVR